MISDVSALISLVLYFGGFVLYFLNFELISDRSSKIGSMLVVAGGTLQYVCLLAVMGHCKIFGEPGTAQEFYAIAVLTAAVAVFFGVRYKASFLMLFSLPVTLVFTLLGLVLSQKSQKLAMEMQPGWLWFHVGFIVAGYAALLVAASAAVMYLLQAWQLKSKQLGQLFLKLPPLAVLDRVHFVALSWGVALFSLGVLGGLFWAQELQSLAHVFGDVRVTISFLVCGLYWVVLGLRMSRVQKEKKIARSTIVLSLLLVVAMLSSHTIAGGFHR